MSTQPTIGRILHYKLTEEDAKRIERRRRQAIAGTALSEGNHPVAGDVYPLIVTRVFEAMPPGYETEVNGQVLLDGNDSLWVTSAPNAEAYRTLVAAGAVVALDSGSETPLRASELSDHPAGTWIWPPRAAS